MTLAELVLAPGVETACQQLAAVVPLIVVTNQPEVARGQLTMEVVEEMHASLRRLLPLTDVLCCPHDRDDHCTCRKPLPGMLVEGARRHGITLSRSVMVGDRWSDIAAGTAAGCRTVLIGDGYDETTRSASPEFGAPDLLTAVPGILAMLSDECGEVAPR